MVVLQVQVLVSCSRHRRGLTTVACLSDNNQERGSCLSAVAATGMVAKEIWIQATLPGHLYMSLILIDDFTYKLLLVTGIQNQCSEATTHA